MISIHSLCPTPAIATTAEMMTMTIATTAMRPQGNS